MKYLLYSANYAPEQTGIGKYSGEMASWLVSQGHEVRVVAAAPYYPEWRIADTHRGRPYLRERIDGVEVLRAPLWVPSSPGGLKRILHLLSFAAASLPVMLRQVGWQPDVVLVVAPAFVCAPAALLISRLSGAGSWLHVQDFEVDVAFSQGLLKGRLLRRLVTGVERWLFGRFDRVSSISNRMVDRIHDKGVEPSRVVFFPNWVDTRAIDPRSTGGTYRCELGIADDAVVALFSGSLGRKQGLMLLPEVARRFAATDSGVVFVICGDGVLKPEIEAACRDLPNVRLLPLQLLERLGDLLGMADVHLLPQSEEAADLVMPSKLTGMLASGRPVLATTAPRTEIAAVLEGCGVIVPPGDAARFAEALHGLAADGARRAALGQAARRRAENAYGKAAVLANLELELARLAADGRRRARAA